MQLGVVMDPIASIQIKKDSTFAMLLAGQARGWSLQYMQVTDLYLRDGRVYGRMRGLHVTEDPAGWFQLDEPRDAPLAELDIVLMRKDPPVDQEYLYMTFLLELAEVDGVAVVNRPAAVRDVNEKLYTARFPQCCPPTLVARNMGRLRTFLAEHKTVVVKPLDGMGGESVFRLTDGDPNTGVILEAVTRRGQRTVMAQRFIEEIREGDKRILLIDGEPVPYALARLPAEGEGRANLAVGGRGKGVALTDHDRWICDQVRDTVRAKGLRFVGLDVIGDYLTEINITSPTCIRELDAEYGLDIAGQLLDRIAAGPMAP